MVSISRSVGKLAPFRSPKGNAGADVKFVQYLLNDALKAFEGKVSAFTLPLDTDGVCGGQTIRAIQFYQTKVLKHSRPDSTLDPGGPTISSLLASVDANKLCEYWNHAVASSITTDKNFASSIAQTATNANRRLTSVTASQSNVAVGSYNIIDEGLKLTIEDVQNNQIVVRKKGSRAWRNNNPGNIRFSAFSRSHGAIGEAGGFSVFLSESDGFSALSDLLKSPSYRNLSLSEAMNKYAPPSENNTSNYIRLINQMTGLQASVILSELNETQVRGFAGAIQQVEGWIPGQITVCSR